MLWYKSWVDTRWRFLIGMGLLMLSAAGVVFMYPRVMKLLPMAPAVDTSGELGRRIQEAMELSRTYRGYVYSQWFQQNLPQMWTIVAVLLGSGGVLAQGARGGALFTLSMPASRNRLIGARAAAGLGELLVLAVVPPLLLPLLSPAVGATFGVGDALIHSVCLFAAGAVFFSLAFLLSTSFDDLWRPMLITLAVAMVLALCGLVFRDLAPYSVFTVMSGEVYFRTGHVPWLGLLASLAASAAMLYVATINMARRDF
jgi:ABC-type transport system involved in multi-copper enzyme maturation permease subunit